MPARPLTAKPMGRAPTRPGHPHPVLRCGPAGVDDAVVVELPASGEGGGVDGGELRPRPLARPVDASWGRRHPLVQTVAQERQLLELVEPGLPVRLQVVGPERGSADPVIAQTSEAVQPATDLLRRRQHRAGQGEDLGRGGVTGPRPHPNGRPAGAQHDIGHAEAAGESDHLPDGSVRLVGLLFATHPRYLDHVASPNHPERP